MDTSGMTQMKSIERLILHHAAFDFKSFPEVKGSDPAAKKKAGAEAIFKEVHAWHKRRWRTGCGYHFAIGNGRGIPDGSVAIWRPLRYQGAHTGGQNHDSIGIMLMGDLSGKLPSRAQVEGTIKLVAQLCFLYNLDPLGTYKKFRFALRNKGPVISGHRDWRNHHSNACPGGLHELLPSMRKSVAALVDLESSGSGVYLGVERL